MKKIFLIFAILMLTVNLHSQEYDAQEHDSQEYDVQENNSRENGASYYDDFVFYDDAFFYYDDPKEKGPFRMKPRSFELGIANFNVGFANNFLTAGEIFTETLVVDFDNFDKGFRVAFDLNVRPLFFNVNVKNNWGFGLDIANITAYGNLDIAGNLLQFKQTDGDEFGVGAAVFVDVGVPVFFHVRNIYDRDLKIKFRPAGFVPIAYTEPEMIYKYINSPSGTLFEIGYQVKVFTPVNLDHDNMISTLDVSSALGFDFSIGAEYPLFSWLNVGVNITNFPFLASNLNHYMEMNGKIWMDSSKLNLGSLLGDEEAEEDWYGFPDDFEPSFGEGNEKIRRPFKMVFYADYYPFESHRNFSVIPILGFSVNRVYPRWFGLEAGAKARYDIANMFITTLGVTYEDRMFQNGIDFIFNLKVFELNLGVATQSQRFLQSWQAAGVRANVGIKIGG